MKNTFKMSPATGVLLVFAGLLFPSAGAAQAVWPGDVNNNGRVNSVDFLYWGLAFNAAGPARPAKSVNWSAQAPGQLWAQSFPNGLNFAFADCDGDGTVDNSDASDGIEGNFEKIRDTPSPDGFLNGTPGASPGVRLVPNATSVLPGATVNIDVLLGAANLPVTNFYGIAMKLRYTAGLIKPSPDLGFLEAENAWIDPDGKDSKSEIFPILTPGQAEIALTRTNQQTIATGFGKVASLTIVIEDIIVGKAVDTFRLIIDSILLIDNNLNKYRVATDALQILVKNPNATSADHEPSSALSIRIAPNPSRGVFWVESGEPLQTLRLFDALGRMVSAEVESRSRTQYRISMLKAPPGLYHLVGAGPAGAFRRTLIISP